MTKNKIVLFSLVHILSIIRVSLLETVHFTNSPNKILKANNFTTYKVGVPHGDPITIIEGNSPLIDKKFQFNEVKDSKYPINHNQQRGSQHQQQQVLDLKTSLSMTVTPNNYNSHSAAYENLPQSNVDEESVANNDYNNLSPEQNFNLHQGIKTVYSPELLEKFLKDYANKVNSAASDGSASNASKMKNPFENIINNDKYNSIENQDNDGAEDENDEESNRRVSSALDDPAGLNDIQERKQYRPSGSGGYYSNSNNNKNPGWVTLEAVPYSKSKISKWHSYAKPQQTSNHNQNAYNYYPSSGSSGSGSQQYNNRPRPQSIYPYEEDNDNYHQRPGKPTFQNNQFFSTGPPPRPINDNRYTIHASSSGFDNYDHHRRPTPPPHPSPYHHHQSDIVTDNRPSNFPQHSGEHHNSYNRPRPDSYDRPSRPFNDYGSFSSFSSNGNHYSNKDGPHPITYPNSGNDGEWILVSTTKGYQTAKRHGQRAMLLQAQNGFSESGSNNGIVTAASQSHGIVIKPPTSPSSSGPTKLMNQQLKLTILPLQHGQDDNRNYQSNSLIGNGMEVNNVYKPPNYNGIIEADPSHQTMDESVAQAALANEQNALAVNSQKPSTKKKVIRKPNNNKNFTIMRKNSGSDSASVLAAVGAGLLPASIGLIAPMMLGKK